MWIIKLITIINIAILVSGCVGDSAILVHGIAPKNSQCEVRLVSDESGNIVSITNVSGEFTETFIWGSFAHTGNMNLIGVCDGKVTKSINKFRSPNKFSEAIEIGDISP